MDKSINHIHILSGDHILNMLMYVFAINNYCQNLNMEMGPSSKQNGCRYLDYISPDGRTIVQGQ